MPARSERYSNGFFVPVPLCRQETAYTCGVACVQSILGCYGINYRQDFLAQQLQSNPRFGTDYRDIIRFMQQLGFQASLVEGISMDCLKNLINGRVTPLLLIQAWSEDCGDYTSDWHDNHYVLACGYTANRIFFMDPWTLGNYTYLPDYILLKRWHSMDQFGYRYDHSGLVIKKAHSPFQYNPWDLKYLG